MAFTESTIARYFFRVKRSDSYLHQQHDDLVQSVEPGGALFKFKVTALLIPSNSLYARNLFQTDVFISCEEFFEDNQSFKERLIKPPYLTAECVDRITERMVPEVLRLCPQRRGPRFAKASSRFRVIPLELEIVVDEFDHVPVEVLQQIVMEESMHEEARMIPASHDAIQSLQTYKLPKKCDICMEKFHDEEGGDDDDDDVEFTPMPCGHGYHHHCIVQWLQTSHFCPLCRYPMPSDDN